MPLTRTLPWLPEMVGCLLRNRINSGNDINIFEYGSGASTWWFCNYCDLNNVKAQIISVEHDADWYNEIKKYDLPNLTLINHPLPYDTVINDFPDNHFDIILVDGRHRNKCIKAAISKLKNGGWLILDNSEREYYQAGKDLMKDWCQVICTQPQPDAYQFTYPGWECTIFIKP